MNHIVLLTAGEYSDYRVLGIFKVLKHLDTSALTATWLLQNPDGFDDEDFVAWLAKEGYIEDAAIPEQHIDLYQVERMQHNTYEPGEEA